MASNEGHGQPQFENCSLVNHKSCYVWALFYTERYFLHENYMDSLVEEGQCTEQGCHLPVKPRNGLQYTQLGLLWIAHEMLHEWYMINPGEYAQMDRKLHLSFTSYPPSTKLCLLEMSKNEETVKNPPHPNTYTEVFLFSSYEFSSIWKNYRVPLVWRRPMQSS